MGDNKGNFRLEANITCAEFAVVAARFAELTEGKKTFTDVPETQWAYNDIIEATSAHDYVLKNGAESRTK